MQSPAPSRRLTHAMTPNGAACAACQFEPNLLLRDFLQERWKGVTPILWGRNCARSGWIELIYLSLLNADHLPDRTTRPARSATFIISRRRDESRTARITCR